MFSGSFSLLTSCDDTDLSEDFTNFEPGADNFFHSETFVMASFDNLDKNQSYAMVGAGKDRSGFHGTTIQAVYSKPSEKNLQVELVSAGFCQLDHQEQQLKQSLTFQFLCLMKRDMF
jgi:hypothetical protein